MSGLTLEELLQRVATQAQGKISEIFGEPISSDMGNTWDNAWEIDPITGSNWSFGFSSPGEPAQFSITEEIGGTVEDSWDSVDRAKFTLTEDSFLDLYTDRNVITELVRFDSSGGVSVVAGVEYGDRIQTSLTAGDYGLSFFVEGDAVNFAASGYFS